MRCGVCSRLLDQPSEPMSADCGGDCWGCVGQIEAELGYPDSVKRVREEVASGFRPSLLTKHEAAGTSASDDLPR